MNIFDKEGIIIFKLSIKFQGFTNKRSLSISKNNRDASLNMDTKETSFEDAFASSKNLEKEEYR
ncbi:4338_t:CDS:2 [Rhizophagus irregularis]|nr:4338_t:CDS:2 [Rhizophagus irregularis]